MTDFEFLLLLRENTILDPISYLKVRKLRKLAEDYQIVINSKEHCNLGVDYSKANELETKLRYKIWYDKYLTERYNIIQRTVYHGISGFQSHSLCNKIAGQNNRPV